MGIGEVNMTKLSNAERWQKFYRSMRSLLTPHTIICYEHVHHHAGVRAAHVYGAFLALLELAAYETSDDRLTFVPVTPTQLKKFATGKGNASKLHMIDAAHTYFSDFTNTCQIRTHNEADAFWIVQFGIQKGEPTHLCRPA